MKKIYILLFAVVALCSCEKTIPVGFLSDNIRMREDTMEVVRGLYVVSSIPMIDASTRPLHFEIVNAKNLATGEISEAFSKKYSIKLWKSSFNPDTDTTSALVNQKLNIQEVSPVIINPVSGQLAFNAGTTFIKEGDTFGIDVKVSNESSSKTFENFGKVKLVTRSWEVANNFGEYLHGTRGAKTDEVIFTRNPLPATEMEEIRANTHPNYSIRKVADSEEVKIKLIFLDSQDRIFPGEAIAKWPDGASYINCWFDNSLDTKILNDGAEFNFPTVPFPAFGRTYTGGRESICLSYYTLHPAYYEMNELGLAKIAASSLKDCTAYNLRVKITYQINEPGVWEVRVKFAYANKK